MVRAKHGKCSEHWGLTVVTNERSRFFRPTTTRIYLTQFIDPPLLANEKFLELQLWTVHDKLETCIDHWQEIMVGKLHDDFVSSPCCQLTSQIKRHK